MPDHIDIPLGELLLYEGDELIFDGSDPTTYTVLVPDTDSGARAAGTASPAARPTGRPVISDADPGVYAWASTRTR